METIATGEAMVTSESMATGEEIKKRCVGSGDAEVLVQTMFDGGIITSYCSCQSRYLKSI